MLPPTISRASRRQPLALAAAAALGVGTDLLPHAAHVPALALARGLLSLFMNALSLVSLPIIFLALSTTLAGMDSLAELKRMGRRVVALTLLTTVLAATVALGLWTALAPAGVPTASAAASALAGAEGAGYGQHLARLIPRNPFQPFIEGNVVAVLLMAVAFGLALLQVPGRRAVVDLGSTCLAALMQVVGCIRYALAPVVWAGVVVSMPDLRHGGAGPELARYLACVLAANLVQGAVVLPALLYAHGIAPWPALRGFAPALNMAFFSKSSVATLPVAIEAAESKLGVDPAVARFTFPVCTTINMNGCAAFILITVLTVATAHGHPFTPLERLSWVGIATLAAVGNAGVPMGCYFLASAMLSSMGIPLTQMALILPFYSLLDMVETALNVWSDACVAILVSQHRARDGRQPAAVAG